MAFTFTSFVEDHTGKKFASGSYASSGGSTGGSITTGLGTVEIFMLTPKGAAVTANQSVYNATLPLNTAGGIIPIVTDANQSGSWLAIGY
jgi:hypothetical protein